MISDLLCFDTNSNRSVYWMSKCLLISTKIDAILCRLALLNVNNIFSAHSFSVNSLTAEIQLECNLYNISTYFDSLYDHSVEFGEAKLCDVCDSG